MMAGVSKIGVCTHKWWFRMEHPIKMDDYDLGVSLFPETSMVPKKNIKRHIASTESSSRI